MGYRSLRACLDDLERTGQLRRVSVEIDPRLEAAEIQRRVYLAGGPAILFERLKDCRFPAVSNLFGTLDRARFIFRDALERVRRLVELKVDPAAALRHPVRYAAAIPAAWAMRPKWVSRGPVLEHETSISQLPAIQCWPEDGGPFITLPIVATEHPAFPGWRRSNLGMYRVQLAGNQYERDREVGLHYQIHRTIGVHHAEAIRRGDPLRVNIFVGGPPALTLAAVMPLPEALSELTFAGALGGRRVRLIAGGSEGLRLADADFCITGTIDDNRHLPEGPFGDHLGYYSLRHDFPVLRVERVSHRRDAIWPFTVVGRPPQEDTTFGALIHELTGPAIPAVLPGVKAVHAVDAAGVHPLLLAIGQERYVPYAARRRPQELLTQAHAILGQGQLSLAKYLLMAAAEDDPQLDIHNVSQFFQHVLRRVDWGRDLHFQTATTMDTLDYSGAGLNEGSKLVIAAVGPIRRELPTEISGRLQLPAGYTHPRLALPGALVIQAPPCAAPGAAAIPSGQPSATSSRFRDGVLPGLAGQLSLADPVAQFPLLVLADDSRFATETLRNWLWVTFTRSDPAVDIDGVAASTVDKHWGCAGPLIIDARIKPHHADPLREDPDVSRRVEQLAARGGPLHGLI